MFNVSTAKECGCIKKDKTIALPKNFTSKEEAELEALRLANHMNKFYCKKHRFHVDEVDGGFVIDFDYSCKEGGQ
jgi:hypothetical protein